MFEQQDLLCSHDHNNRVISADWTLKCGPGWESNPTSDYCYIFVDEPLSWLDAKNQCQNFKGQLVAIESLEEINYLAGRPISISILTLTFLNQNL